MITLCICLNKSFDQVKKVADEKKLVTLSEVMSETGCGKRCRKCRPYIEKMLETGQTEFLTPLEN
jgi:bacterioferritin-associated ferredoxin